MKKYRLYLLLLCVFTMSIYGCSKGPERFGFSGTVTFKGAPLEEGNLRLFPQGKVEGATFCDAVIQNGTFSFPAQGGLSAGTYLVKITAVDKKKSVFEESGPVSSGTTKIVELIPPEWNVKSEKTVEVKTGQNVFDFKID